ncbi:hypothetical protein P7E30_02705 [Enterococcus gallinarum]|uniref:Uncharacterized protein n=3 Tax=Enterococcus gallinarum TaxID=1353 RepID=A0AAE4HPF4_ENTGA|nr:hypothetical protein [Enterococcus gallinarum]ROY75229.1 hypothetical protein EGW90_03420 [Enterococcus gallinarum]ROZ07702.1 hypothetical protein EGX16_03450 [Enterococcus gallinarum]ROZ13478.1 hypothetical protein EGX22_03455 [Enterococcus gallinarum]ROZ35029.1 hypothetical protein EGX24_03425 [Enterococcus gallinarum]
MKPLKKKRFKSPQLTMMQKQEASIETHDEHNQSFMILIVFNKKALAKSGDFCQCLFIQLLKSAKDITRRLAVLKKKQ